MPVVDDDDDGQLEDIDDSERIRRMIESDLVELGVTIEGLDAEADSQPRSPRGTE